MERVPRTVLVAGAAGGVGEGIVRALVERTDVHVIATSRSAARLAELTARLGPAAQAGRVTGIAGDAGDPHGAVALAARIRAGGVRLDVAVPSLGGWWEGGPLLDVDAPAWDAVMTEMLRTHFAFARAFVPLLAERAGGWYLAIGGGAALLPVVNSGLVSIAAAGQMMLTRVLAAENAARGVRITELIVNGPVRTRASDATAAADWITADDVGGVVADLVRDGTTTWPALRERGPLLIMDPVSGRPAPA